MVPQRRLGRTGLAIPRITLGAGWVGGWLIRADREARFAQLDAAMAAGVDWIDTAALYGKGQSETNIGEWLAATGARPRLSTKFSIDRAAGDIEGQIRRSVEASFSRLGVDRVEALLLHNQIVRDSAAQSSISGVAPGDVLVIGGVADIMHRLREEGLCDHIGFTGLGEPAAVQSMIRSGHFDVVQIYYNMLNPTAGGPAPAGWNSTDFMDVLADCEAEDVGVMGIRIFASGHLAAQERHGREIPLTANADDRAEEARAEAAYAALAGEAGSRAQIALRFGLAEERLSTIVIGIGEDWHFRHALEALELGPLGPDALARLAGTRASHEAFIG